MNKYVQLAYIITSVCCSYILGNVDIIGFHEALNCYLFKYHTLGVCFDENKVNQRKFIKYLNQNTTLGMT